MFSLDELRARGFTGFRPLLNLDTNAVTAGRGVYVVLTDPAEDPRFLPSSGGGRFKQRDPTVTESVLSSRWVDASAVVYVGKANSLRSRLRQFRDFGQGRPVAHWGGRLIWQLESHADLLVGWRATTEEPRLVEKSMLQSSRLAMAVCPSPTCAIEL
jgi:hypothetical protein